MALGVYGAASGSGAAAGVLLGGLLTSYLSWSWIFFINVPVGIAAIALTPTLLRDSRAELAPRRFDVAGAASITGGLMLLVYALTRATADGWGSTGAIGSLAGAIALVAAFVGIELRSRSPLLPLRIFRLRTLCRERHDGDRQRRRLLRVLPADAVPAGRAPLLAAPGWRGLRRLRVDGRRRLERRPARRRAARDPADADRRAAPSAASVAVLARLPLDGRYLVDLLPAFLVGAAGMGLTFVPVAIAGLTGVERAHAGVASGLINTSRQIGGAVGIAALSAVAAASTSGYVRSHARVSAAAALDHGLQTGLYALTGLLVAGALLAATLVRPARLADPAGEALLLEDAA